MESKKKTFLIVLDGFGLTDRPEGNAVRTANPEFLNKLFRERPFTRLAASGLSVGLPEDQPGNSEVGHLNIGAGRIVHHDITRINEAIDNGSFFEDPLLNELFSQLKVSRKALHLLGLVSNNGVHSHISHLYACLKLAKKIGLGKVFIHAFTDGRDASTTSGVHFIKELVNHCREIGLGKVASISGRYYAMDRDSRWDRIEKAYLALVHGVGNRMNDPIIAMEASYKGNVTDEFVVPVVIEENGQPVATIENGDGILAFNFRADRMRQLSRAFMDKEFPQFKRKELELHFVSMTKYCETFSFPSVFHRITPQNVLGEVLSAANIPQLRVAETEKYSHVTYFFNGGIEPPFPLEERIMVPSPKVKTYDQKPEMAAFELGDLLMEKLQNQKFPFILANFANCDMVGHTGNMDAAVKAISALDCVLSKVVPVAYDLGYDCLLTSDHGNVEQMIDYSTGDPSTENTGNPVPFCILSRDSFTLRSEGKLGDIAPTVLDLMNLPIPAAMTGASLIQRKK